MQSVHSEPEEHKAHKREHKGHKEDGWSEPRGLFPALKHPVHLVNPVQKFFSLVPENAQTDKQCFDMVVSGAS
ncbi:MAG TPA: hypothetical protein VFS24_17480, partial [Steroidobacteraceae bacterium]|nr:hypothetical protein [Steroidobacteraceae bacterium]